MAGPDPKHAGLAVLLALAGVLAVGRAEDTGQEVRQWLEQMNRTARTLNYEGTFVYVQGQALEAMRIIHSYQDGSERQRLYSLNGTAREVLVRDDRVISVMPDKRIAVSGRGFKRSPFPLTLPRELAALERHYRFEVLGDDRIAGLATRVIDIAPLDQLRFGYRLWLDKATAMVLRSALLDEKGRYIEQLMFTELEIKPAIDPGKLTDGLPDAAIDPPPETQEAGEPVTASNWVLADPPPGFAAVHHSRFTEGSDRRPTEHIVYTDGLATVSVFLDKLDGGKPLLEGASRMGSMNAFGTVKHDHQVLVVGEVPRVTVEAIAAALDYRSGVARHD